MSALAGEMCPDLSCHLLACSDSAIESTPHSALSAVLLPFVRYARRQRRDVPVQVDVALGTCPRGATRR
jgi:hypothetical protein